MTIWYAQAAGNASEIAWEDDLSNPLTWAELDAADTLDSNGYNVTIDGSITCALITSGVAGAGGFSISDGGWDPAAVVSDTIYFDSSDNSINNSSGLFALISAGQWIWVQGSTTELYTNGPKLNNGFFYVSSVVGDKLIVSSPWGGTLLDEAAGTEISIYKSGIVITANLTAGATTCLTSTVPSGDAVLVVGNVTGGTLAAFGCNINSLGSSFIIGDVTGGVASVSFGVYVASGRVCRVIGDAYGGADYRATGYAPFDTNADARLYGNIINNDGGAGCSGAVVWQPYLPTHYIQYPDGSGGTIKAYAEDFLAAASSVLDGVTNGPDTGTLAAPAAPTLAVADDGDGSVTATVTGTGTIALYYRLAGASAWTAGSTRSGDGTISQSGLTAGTAYEFYAAATDTIPGVPSPIVTCFLAGGSGTPVIETIALNIESAVNAITTGNGFTHTLTAVRPRRNDWVDVAPADGNVLIWQSDDAPTDSAAVQTTQLEQEFLLIALVIDSDAATASIDTRINQVAADLRKKLLADTTRGGFALDTRLGPASKFDDGQGFSGVAVSVMVDYRTDYDDPYTQL